MRDDVMPAWHESIRARTTIAFSYPLRWPHFFCDAAEEMGERRPRPSSAGRLTSREDLLEDALGSVRLRVFVAGSG